MEEGAGPLATRPPLSATALAAVFTATILLSSSLLFAVQPMFARMVLPLLGGAPSVWTVSLCFFQGALLAGYAYAHVLRLWLPPARAGIVHICLLAVAVLSLPIAIPAGWTNPPAGEPALWQLALFAVAIGLPFTLLSANAPLLQSWFAVSGHPRAGNPYFLYAASNVGSLAALLGYPLVLEPAFGVTSLARAWTVLFVVLIAAIALCTFAIGQVGRSERTGATAPTVDAADAPRHSWGERLRWAWLAAVPSALLTAFTAHIATDLASAPLIWVLPLSVYLATFIVVFREPALIPGPVLTGLHVAFVILALLQLSQVRIETAFIGAICGGLAFVTATLSAHRTLYDARPAAARLTEFYLALSAGGALGGVFAALVAPRIFTEVYEYPLLLAMTLTCTPRLLTVTDLTWRSAGLLVAATVAGAALLAALPWAMMRADLSTGFFGATFLVAALYAIVAAASFSGPRLRAIAGVLMAATVILLPSNVNRGDATRSFFGVYRVRENYTKEFNYLSHGTTLHGAQRVREPDGTLALDTTPLTYYHPQSPMAESVRLQRAAADRLGRPLKVAIIGLGTGAMGCHAQAFEAWRFFEIDPAVIHIASNPVNFSFLDTCQPKADIVLGDARLTMAREADGAFDLIVVDAFSSDAVPIHLMTAEALDLYARKLSPIGVAVLHISNRYLDLDTAVAATVPAVKGLDGTLVVDNEHLSADGFAQSLSTVAVISRSGAALEPYRALPEAQAFDAKSTRPWTDDHADILGAILRRVKWGWPW